MKITLTENLKQKPDFKNLGFGKYFTDHMLYMEYVDGKWGEVEIDHRADTDKEYKRHNLVHFDSDCEKTAHYALRARKRNVDKNRPESHRQQQRGFHILFDCKENQQRAETPHYYLLPGNGCYGFVQKFHKSSKKYGKTVEQSCQL